MCKCPMHKHTEQVTFAWRTCMYECVVQCLVSVCSSVCSGVCGVWNL